LTSALPDQNIGFPTKGTVPQPGTTLISQAHSASDPRLPGALNAVSLGAQLAFYFLSLSDLLIPESNPLKRLTSPVRTFVVLMAASFRAAAILFRPNANYWTTTTVTKPKTVEKGIPKSGGPAINTP